MCECVRVAADGTGMCECEWVCLCDGMELAPRGGGVQGGAGGRGGAGVGGKGRGLRGDRGAPCRRIRVALCRLQRRLIRVTRALVYPSHSRFGAQESESEKGPCGALPHVIIVRHGRR